MGGLGVWLGLCNSQYSINKKIDKKDKGCGRRACTCVQTHDLHAFGRRRKNNYQVYFVDVLRHAPPFEVAVRIVRRH